MAYRMPFKPSENFPMLRSQSVKLIQCIFVNVMASGGLYSINANTTLNALYVNEKL